MFWAEGTANGQTASGLGACLTGLEGSKEAQVVREPGVGDEGREKATARPCWCLSDMERVLFLFPEW